MLLGHLDSLGTYNDFLKHLCWHTALQWAQRHRTDLDKLTHGQEIEIQGREIYAIYKCINFFVETKPGKVESHRRYADIHICLDGRELIGWRPVELLDGATEYDAMKDLITYDHPVTPMNSIELTSDYFMVLNPKDGHLPEQESDGCNFVQKFVIKVETKLFEYKSSPVPE